MNENVNNVYLYCYDTVAQVYRGQYTVNEQ